MSYLQHADVQKGWQCTRPATLCPGSRLRPRLRSSLSTISTVNNKTFYRKNSGRTLPSISKPNQIAAVLELGVTDLQHASDTSRLGHKDVHSALQMINLPLSQKHLLFVRDNFHVDHCGFLVRPCSDMLKTLHEFGYSLIAQFPSVVVSKILKDKYPLSDVSVTVYKLQSNICAEKLELFVVQGLTQTEFAVEAQAINHLAFSPNALNTHFVNSFKAVLQASGFQQSTAGINKAESGVYGGQTIQGVTLVYFNRGQLTGTPNQYQKLGSVEICMAGIYPELLKAA